MFLRDTALAAAAVAAALAFSSAVRAESGISKDEIHIGSSSPLSGPVAQTCGLLARGATAYFEDINKQGGVNGRKIRYEVLDDALSAQRAVANTQRLLKQSDVFALFNGCGTAPTSAVLTLVDGTDVPLLFPYAGLSELIAPPKPNVFATLPTYDMQTRAILPYALDRVHPATAFMLSVNIPGIEDARKIVRETLQQHNVKLLGDDLMDVASPERTPFVLAAKDKNPDLLILNDSTPGAARFFLEMQRQGWKPKGVTGIFTMADEAFLRVAAGPAENLVITPAPVVPATDPKAKQCVEDLKAYDSSVAPTASSMMGCLNAMIFVEALRRSGPEPTRATFVQALSSLSNFETGISGPITFTPANHMGVRSLLPITVENGAFKVMGPALSDMKSQ